MSGGSLKEARSRSKEKKLKNVDFSLWGNCATNQSSFGWLHDSSLCVPFGNSPLEFFQKTLILAFEANSALCPAKMDFFLHLAHCVLYKWNFDHLVGIYLSIQLGTTTYWIKFSLFGSRIEFRWRPRYEKLKRCLLFRIYIGKLKRNFRQKQAQMNEKVSVHSIYALEFGKEGLSGYFYLHIVHNNIGL